MPKVFVKRGLCEDGSEIDIKIPSLGRPVLPNGESVEMTPFVERRIKEGSLIIVPSVVEGAKEEYDSI